MDNAFPDPAKAQSAMEYLMTYGWAILIIAVVLGALFELGVFNGTFFMPHVPPGSCHVFRPYGPGTVSSINLEGECQGALPQYVAEFNGKGNVSTYYVQTAITEYTISAWVKTTYTGGVPIVQDRGSGAGNSVTLELGYNGGQLSHPGTVNCGVDSNGVWIGGYSTQTVNDGSWHFVACVFTSVPGNAIGPSDIAVYVDGKPAGLLEADIGSSTSPIDGLGGMVIGYHQAWGQYAIGDMADIQIYNTSLDQNSITTLYNEGIGGAPVNLQNLVGWWPLNGNANDYSGSNNDGTAANVVYTTNWESGYTQP